MEGEKVFRRMFRAAVLAMGIAAGALCCLGAGQVSGGLIEITDDAVKYKDEIITIEITGTWESAAHDGLTITFEPPSGDHVYVTCSCAAGYKVYVEDIDPKMKGGHVTYGVKSDSVEEDSHEVTLNFERSLVLDLDCDADWDGEIEDEEDDPIEVSVGGIVGLEKTADLTLQLEGAEDYPNGEYELTVFGNIAVMSGDRELVNGVYPSVTAGLNIVTLSGNDLSGPLRVRGVYASNRFGDCSLKVTYKSDGRELASDTVNFTVLKVDVSIDGQGEDEEESEGAYSLFVDDCGETPYAPRATNYLKKVSIQILPDDFPEHLQTNLIVELDGDIDHLFELKPTVASWGMTQYAPAEKTYNMKQLNEQKKPNKDGLPYFALHGHSKSSSLRDKHLAATETKTGVEDQGLFTVVKLNLVPDYDRNHIIDGDDEHEMCMDKKFYWWNNDDHDKGDSASFYKDHGSEIHGAKAVEITRYISKEPNMANKEVDGRTDLLDFFPLWVDARDAFTLLGKDDIKFEMTFPGLGIVGTKLTAMSAGDFLKKTCFDSEKEVELCKAAVDKSGVTDFQKYVKFMNMVADTFGAGILMVEGAGGGDVTLNLKKLDQKTGKYDTILSATTLMSMRDVREFYNVVSLYDGKADLINTRAEELDELFCDNKDVFSLHGFKVDKVHAEGWHSEFFKRLYQSQSHAEFWGVTWDSNQSNEKTAPGLYYHQDAAHAFKAAKLLTGFINEQRAKGKIKGELTMMAHSLGNMVVSPAIVREGLKVDRYLMLNAAVPAEAYDGEKDDERMVNPAWKEYPKKSFCSKWYKRFEGFPDVEEGGGTTEDARKNLRWPNQFSSINCPIYNYYSLGDEVFELADKISMAKGFKIVLDGYYDLCRYCWHKQEVGKGADMLFNRLVDNNPAEGIVERSGGWGFHNNVITNGWFWPLRWRRYHHVYTPAMAENASNDDLMRNPVFAHTPAWAFEWNDYNNRETREYTTGLLCHVIPAMSKAAGLCALTKAGGDDGNRNLNSDDYRWGWGRSGGTYETRWLHCDLKDMAYFYNYPAWDQMVADGNFMKDK